MNVSLSFFCVTEADPIFQVNNMDRGNNVICRLVVGHLCQCLSVCTIVKGLSELLIGQDRLVRVRGVDAHMAYGVGRGNKDSGVFLIFGEGIHAKLHIIDLTIIKEL